MKVLSTADDKLEKQVSNNEDEMNKIKAARGHGHRQGVSAEVVSDDTIANFVKPVYPKSDAAAKQLTATIQKNDKMKVLAGTLSDEALADVVNAFQLKTVLKDHDVIHQGDVGDCLYICEEGELEVFVARADPSTGKLPEGKGNKVLTVGPEALFGELALMYSAPRAATVTVASATAKLWALERDAFKMLLVSKGAGLPPVYQGYLRDVAILKVFNDHELSAIAEVMESSLYDAGEVVVSQAEAGENFFIVEDGTCSAFMTGPNGEKEMKKYIAGDYFGEIAVLTGEKRKTTVRATGEGCTAFSISKENFVKMLGPIKDSLTKNIEKYPTYAEQPELLIT